MSRFAKAAHAAVVALLPAVRGGGLPLRAELRLAQDTGIDDEISFVDPQGRRHVVNIASMAAFLPGPQAGIYTASKFAVRGLTESLRYNLAPHRIGCSLCCPALTRTNAWTSALKRPDSFKDSGFAPARAGELEQFGTAFEEGMDPYEVGTKILNGMTEQRGLILTHPEHGPDFEEIHAAIMAALPQEEAPPGRLKIEQLRREATKAAEAGLKISLDDLT